MTIEDRVKAIIAIQLCAVAAELRPETNLGDDLGADSLDQIELVMAMEDEFRMEISDEDADGIKTVQQAVDYITAKVPA